MSATLSYAHAAGAASSDVKEEKAESSKGSLLDIPDVSLPAVEQKNDVKEEKSEEPAPAAILPKDVTPPEVVSEPATETCAESNLDDNSKPVELSPKPNEAESKEAQEAQKKVKLAPAPPPPTNAWGTTPKPIPVSRNPITETILSETNTGDSNGPSLFKAPVGKEKWVPFKASVVIASGKNATPSKAGSTKKKNKKKSTVQEKHTKKEQQLQQPQSKPQVAVKSESKDLEAKLPVEDEGSKTEASLAEDENDNTVKSEEEVSEASSSPQDSENAREPVSVLQNETSSDVDQQPQQITKKHAHSPAGYNNTNSNNNNNNVNGYPYRQHYQNTNGKVYNGSNGNRAYNNANRPYSKRSPNAGGANTGVGNGQNGGASNGSYQQRQYRPHQGQNRRYSNGEVPYIPYNRQYYMPMMFVNGNGTNTAPSANGNSVPSASEEAGAASPNSNGSANNQRHHGNHHGRRNNFASPYMMQPFYAPMGYLPYGQSYGPIIPQNRSQYGAPPEGGKSSRENQLDGLASQIDYYFSPQNLIKDIFLRKNMNDEGFLPLTVVAAFYRVSAMSFNDINAVIECLDRCKNLEYGLIEGENGEKFYKVRPIDNPHQWILSEDQRTAAGRNSTAPSIHQKNDPTKEVKTTTESKELIGAEKPAELEEN
ncbi:DEKNAAC104876 [Brettanomyces naardenensis]|uniref:DEKNAAC104876 n=1 Tax=Brettanomyces naardenensis TaxID=13370 RepID=A0A448YS06_BRENA|nr:DEKNAAC104876 [Brettanomyces naardenensis]